MVDLKVVEIILVSGLGGLGVRAVVSMLKSMFKLDTLTVKIRKILTLLLTVAVCAAAVAIYLVPTGLFAWGLFAAYTAFVFLASQGYYRISHS